MVLIQVLFAAFVFMEGRLVAMATGSRLLDDFIARDDVLVKWAGYGDEKISTVVIGGKVLCHGNGAKERTAIHPYPISGATVAVMCAGKTKKPWAKTKTDEHGDFTIDVPSRLHAIPNLEKVCHVKVVHLPRGTPCRHACAGKLKRIQLLSVREGIRTYTADNINLMSHKRK